ncbi:sigma-54 dependent transcriptional regulator [Uliginosibacterium sp. H3]|uniref:Sigma-54 dependent transcriptional regulator n=1 Tax=Uliginosibacterium silvisoli TaxID=3114758 RepID=A0ABU6K8C8_9RHOO|nr:sigma-54 dependent transcriptional regulator [Uliginosibacterium sp. H3]
MPRALIVDDDENTRMALAALIEAEGFSVDLAKDLRDARISLVRQTPDVVLTDLKLPDGTGMDLFKEFDPKVPVELIVMTGFASVDTAVDALRQGAADYLVKPVNIQRLQVILARVPRGSDLRSEIGQLRGELRRYGKFGRMLGNSPAMQTLYDQINRVAPTEATVLLVGESGTGKELAAQSIHDLSLRRKQAFLPVNCGAISPNLIESEMFGHERGSFTGADRQHRGYFERADGGTIFLDEITEMPIELQVKLLRVLESGVFMRVGTNKEIATDVRVVAATNRDPEAAVAEGKLRADLYHRLNVFPLQLPPLRERGKDVELLALSFLEQLNETHNTSKAFVPGAMDALVAHGWPGNVRELRNYVQRAYIMTDSKLIETASVPLQISSAKPATGSSVVVAVGTSLADMDRQLILATLEQCGGVKKRAAEILGISLKTLYNRLEEYGSVARGDSDEDEAANVA